MKVKKVLGLSVLMASLMLAACNGGNKSSEASKQPSSSQPSQSQPASNQSQSSGNQQQSSSQQGGQSSQSQGSQSSQQGGDQSSQQGNEKSVTVSALVFEKKNDNKVYVKVTGTQANHTAAEFKWAWGILTGGNQQGGQSGELTDDAFIYGKAAPTAADAVAATFNANNEFTVELCLTDVIAGIADFKAALYTIYGGTPETYKAITPTDASSKAQDNDYKYYVRDDQNCIAIDKLPDVAFETAVIYKPSASELPTGKQEGVYIKIGGEVKAGVTVENLVMDADFQRTAGGNYAKHNIGNDSTEFFWTKDGTKAYVNLYIGFMVDGEGWMTHLGFNVPTTTNWFGQEEKNIPNCYIANDILDVKYTFDGNQYTVHAEESAGQAGGAEKYYGCLGIAVAAVA